jgi:hypothetical protein
LCGVYCQVEFNKFGSVVSPHATRAHVETSACQLEWGTNQVRQLVSGNNVPMLSVGLIL